MTRLLLPAVLTGAVVAALACGHDSESTFNDGSTDAGSASNDSAPPFGFTPGGDAGAPPPVGDVEALITTDNAFSFGYGDGNALATFIPGGPASNGAEIFNCPVDYGPEPFVVPAKDAPAGAFLYIVAWADMNVTQGTLAQFKRTGGTPIYSGSGAWQVCATGQFFDASGPGPDASTVGQYVTQCNAGATGSTYSKGWVNTAGALTPGAVGKLAFGEANDDAGGAFPVVCQGDDGGVHGMDPAARWMWFDPLDGQSPFVGNGGNRTKTFLIFRLPASALDVK